MKLKLIIFTVFFCYFNLANAGPLKKGISAIDNGKYEQAYNILLPLAKKNNATAQFHIGRLLIDELSKNASPMQGVHWLEKATVNGHREAAQTLSKMYFSGLVVSMDSQKGQYYLDLAEKLKPKEGEEEDDCD